MSHSIWYYIGQVVLSLVGSATYIIWVFKKESDKFENSKKDFDDVRYFHKNRWDFLFFVMAGLVMLTVKSVVRNYVGIEGLTDLGLSCLCGLLGSVIIEKLLNKT